MLVGRSPSPGGSEMAHFVAIELFCEELGAAGDTAYSGLGTLM